MKILVLGAAGAMARGTLKDLLAPRSRHVECVVAADLPGARLDALQAEINDPRLRRLALDVRNAAALRDALREVDLCINAVPTFAGHQMTIFDACLAARCHYADYGGMGEFTVRQKQRHADWQAAGITAVLGLGSDPGTSNVVCKAIADRLERIDQHFAAADTTGSIASSTAPEQTQPKIADRILQDWAVREVQNGRALIESRYGGVFDVGAGSVLPGLGRVDSIKRQDGQWLVVTARGTITSGR